MRKAFDVIGATAAFGLGHKTWIRNLLISFGLFWLSLWLAVPLAWLFGRLNNRIIYGDSVLDAIAMGVMTSMGQALAAGLAGVAATLSTETLKPQRWSLVIAALYFVDSSPWRSHWYIPPTAWDRIWQVVHALAPAVFCVMFAAFTARVAHGANSAVDSKSGFWAWAAKSFLARGAGICVALAFLPLAVTIWGIYSGNTIDVSTGWGVLFNPITLAALLWLGATSFYYLRSRAKRAAWIFALFPVAFAEPALLLCVWIWTPHSLK